MKSFTIIPHIADVRLHIKGNTLQELFLAGMEGMAQISKKDFCKAFKTFPQEHSVSINAQDVTSLLIDFLSEVLTHSHVERAIFCKADFSELSPTALRAKIFGAKTNHFDEDIKAVTYHEAQVKKNKRGLYETTIVLDI